jgi:hypothetical protein
MPGDDHSLAGEGAVDEFGQLVFGVDHTVSAHASIMAIG